LSGSVFAGGSVSAKALFTHLRAIWGVKHTRGEIGFADAASLRHLTPQIAQYTIVQQLQCKHGDALKRF
jgi:hypothetical protein